MRISIFVTCVSVIHSCCLRCDKRGYPSHKITYFACAFSRGLTYIHFRREHKAHSPVEFEALESI